MTDRGDWPGCWLPGGALYEIDVPAFTEAGTFGSAVARLDHVVELGVDAVEVGADGPGPSRFVAGCHDRRLGVLARPAGAFAHLDGRLPEQLHARLADRTMTLLCDDGVDGLRVRAPRAVTDRHTADLVSELASTMRTVARRAGRPLALVVDTDLADPRAPGQVAGGYLSDTAGGPTFGGLETPSTVLRGLFGGRPGRPLPAPGRPAPTDAPELVVYLRQLEGAVPAIGQLRRAGLSLPLARLAATVLLAGPCTAALRMGEDWAAPRSRHAEAYLDWTGLDHPANRAHFDYYRRLLALCRTHPELRESALRRVTVERGDDFLTVRRGELLVVANLGATRRRIAVPPWPRSVLIASRRGVTVNAGSIELPGVCAAVISYR